MKPIKKVALLHSLCGVGKASLTNMIPILSTVGVEACPIPTVILSTHTGGYGIPAKQHVDANYIRTCAEHYRENGVKFDMIFIGYLGSADMVSAVQYFLEQFPDAEVILDPIMGDHGCFYTNLNNVYAKSFLKLFPYAHTIMPNLTEACILTGVPYKEIFTVEEIEKICEKLHDMGVKTIVLTSVSTKQQTKGLALSIARFMSLMDMPAEGEDYHGSGDVFDAVAIGSRLQGMTWRESVEKAHRFVCACIRESSNYDYPEREGLMVEKKLSLLV